MKILHIAPLSPYNVGWSYQDNLLPKYHKKMGHDVVVIVSTFENGRNGKYDVGESDFTLDDGIHVYRRKRLFGNSLVGKFLSYTNVKDILNEYKPDFIMVHSIITLALFQAIKYKKKVNKDCIIICDNHLDENIGKRKNEVLTKLYYSYWSIINHFGIKYVSRYYGVTPWRREFLIKRFKIPKEKTDVLIMGADLENIDFSKRKAYRKKLEKEYFLKDQFIIITGGKIDKNKNIINLMDAVKKIKDVKLLIFGTISDDYKDEFESNINSNTIFLGWKNNDQIYQLYLASDLAVFPGGHSVLWEQACACKIPCLFSKWPNMDHLNNGGNSAFINCKSAKLLKTDLLKYIKTDLYYKMKKIAESDATNIYDYKYIAEKSIECVRDLK